MTNDLKIKVDIEAQIDTKKIQAEINKQTKNLKINAVYEIDKKQIENIKKQLENISKIQKKLSNNLNTIKFNSFSEYTADIKDISASLTKVSKSIELINQAIANSQLNNFIAELVEANSKTESFASTIINYFSSQVKKLLSGKEITSLVKNLISNNDTLTYSFASNASEIIKDFNSTNLSAQAYKESIGELDDGMLAYLNTTTNGSANLKGYQASLIQTGIAMDFVAIKAALLNTAVSFGISAIASLIIPKVIEFFDNLYVSFEEQKEISASLQKDYEAIQSQISSVNSELEATKDKINELNSKKNLTVIEKDELNKLKETNSQLERKKDLLDAQAESVFQEKASSERKAIEGKYSGKNFNTIITEEDLKKEEELISDIIKLRDTIPNLSIDEQDKALDKISELQIKLDSVQSNRSWNEVSTGYEWIDQATKRYTELNSKIQNGVELSSKEQAELSSIKKELLNTALELEDAVDNYGIDDNVSRKWKDFSILIHSTLFPNGNGYQKFESIYNSPSFKKSKSELEDFAKAGQLTPEVIESNKSYKELLNDTGLEANELVEIIESLSASSNDASSQILSLSDALTAIQNNGNFFSDVKKELADTGEISLTTLGDIIKTYPELEAAVLKYQSGIISGNDLISHLSDSYDKDKNNYIIAAEAKLGTDADFYQKILNGNKELHSLLNKYYGDDYKNWKTLDEAKFESEKELLSTLGSLWGNYYEYLVKNSEGLYEIVDPVATTYDDEVYDANNPYYKNEVKINKAVEKYNNFLTEFRKEMEKQTLGDLILGGTNGDTNKFSKVFDWISIAAKNASETAKSAIDKISKHLSYLKKNAEIDIAITAKNTEETKLKKIKETYEELAKKVNLSQNYRTLVDNGALKNTTIHNEETAKKIEEYQKWSDAAKQVGEQINGISDEIKELNSQKLENITSHFDSRKNYINAKISNRESKIALKESQGVKVKESDYNALIKLQNQNKKNLNDEYNSYKKTFQEQLNNKDIKRGSEKYFAALQHLNDLSVAANNAESAIYELKNEIREIRWSSFDEGIQKLNNVKDELSGLIDLISNDDVFDSDGNYTKEGYTKLGLYTEQITNSKKSISEYTIAISSLKKELENGNITQKQYDEELANFQSLQREAVNEVKAAEDAIVSLAQAKINLEIDAINKETDAFKESIDAKKKAMDTEKELLDFKKSVEEKTKSTVLLQKQIAALSLSNDRKDIAERLKLEKQLKEKQKEIEESQAEHSRDTVYSALDDEYETYKKSQDDKISVLEKSLNDESTLLKNSLKDVTNHSKIVSEGLKSLASEHGITVTQSIVSPWKSATTALELYKATLDTIPSSTKIKTDSIDLNQSTLPKVLLQKYTGKQEQQGNTALNEYIISKGYKKLSWKEMVQLGKDLGVEGVTLESVKSSGKIRNEILTALKKSGFSKGGSISFGKVIRENNDDVLMTGKVGEEVITSDKVKAISDAARMISNLSNLSNILPNLSPFSQSNKSPFKYPIREITTDSTIPNINIEKIFDVQGNIDEDLVYKLNHDTQYRGKVGSIITNEIVKQMGTHGTQGKRF